MPSTSNKAPSCHAVTGRAWNWSGPPTLQAVRAAAGGVCQFLKKEGLPDEELAAWELLVTEAGNNVVLHDDADRSDRWDVQVLKGDDRVIVRVVDATQGVCNFFGSNLCKLLHTLFLVFHFYLQFY